MKEKAGRVQLRRPRTPGVPVKKKPDALTALLDEMLQATGGPMTESERRMTDRALGVPRARKKKKKRAR